jgi:glyoxylase-like metal-dependent hydrolase (beta-lactamase superfamily II)
MISVHSFALNPIQENTYILFDDTKSCIIIDPGCYDDSDRAELTDFIRENNLQPKRLLNTHCHLDHVFGNRFIADKYNLKLEINKLDLPILNAFQATCNLYGFNGDPSPQPSVFLEEGDEITFGNSKLEILFTPGHSPGSITFYSKKDKFMIVGDVLFNGSIGRTDLPGGHHGTLIQSIKTKLLPLGDDFTVYSGHGPSTTIGFERKHNPFLKE